MDTIFCGQQIIKLSHVDSTNNYAAKLLNDINVMEGTVIMADFQGQGKGQRGANWLSNSGENLLMSLILHPKFIELKSQFNLSKMVAVSLYEYLSPFTDNVQIKWPNDIYFNGKKIAGILIENIAKGSRIKSSIIGIGLNVNQLDFQTDNATSLKLGGINIGLDEALNGVCIAIEKNYLKSKNRGFDFINQVYLEHLMGINEKRTFYTTDRSFEGTIKGVNESGKLLIEIQTNQELRSFDLKEISFFPFQP